MLPFVGEGSQERAGKGRKGEDQKFNFVSLLNAQMKMSHKFIVRYVNLKFQEGFGLKTYRFGCVSVWIVCI